ncbi:MAG: alpha/beta hydrolase [Spirulina sp. DLM2.Bin59]|nr:MAG: alpha/beta hydrolase [Spirulina sp. DLM2.Bin59]
MTLDFITIPPQNNQPPQRLLVALHGWGANLQDLAGLAPAFNLPDYQFIFPNAPFPHPQVPGGRAWYALENGDLATWQLTGLTGLAESREMLLAWLPSLEAETGIPLSKTVLLGFSQGGAMALDVGLQLPLAGLCSISGYGHGPLAVKGEPAPPVLMIHGQQDPIVPLAAAQSLKQELTSLGVALADHELPTMGHDIPPAALAIAQTFIQSL